MGDAQLAVRLLGPVEVDVDGVPADLGGPRQRAVLALLLVARGEVVSVDRLIDDLWRGEPPPRATGALQAYVSNLRRALEPSRPPRTPSTRLVSAPPGYAVRFADGEVDAWHAESLLRAATSADPVTAVRLLREALACWRGPALAEYAAESWAAPEAARLDELRLVVRERLVDAQVRAGSAAEAVLGAEALTRDAPLREEGWRLLALAQYVEGRQGEALATLRRARGLLADELGIDPGPRLAELEQAVLTQTVALPVALPGAAVAVTPPEAPQAPQAPQPADADAAAAGDAAAAAGDAAAAGAAAAAGDAAAERATLVGREAELDTVLGAARGARAGTPAVALVAGEAGGGKSTLLGRVGDELQARGWRVVLGRCPESGGAPAAGAWAQALRTLAAGHDPGPFAADLAPLLSDAPGDTGSPQDALVGRYRLHRAVADWLSTLSDRPLAVLLDDVHRADGETRALLTSLVESGTDGRLAVVAAYRPESTEPLDDLLARLAPFEPARVRLTGLDLGAAAALIESVTGEAPDPATVADLARRTDGNPFYLKESARLLASEGALVATSQVPDGVRDVLRRRLSRLPDDTVATLRLASVLGRDVDVALLVAAAETDEESVLDALEAGVISGLLVEPAPGMVRFSHLLVRETLYSGIARLRRVRWHARVADAVTALYPHDLASLAHHSVQAATPATARRAAEHALAAGALAETRYAFDTAADLYDQAVRCLALSADATAEERVDALSRTLRAQVRSGQTDLALQTRLQAVDIAERSGRDELVVRALIAWNVPTPWTIRRYLSVDERIVGLEKRLLRSLDLDPADRCRLLCVLVRDSSFSGDPDTLPAAQEALRLARELDDPELLGLALAAHGEVWVADVHRDERRELARELLEHARRHGLVVYEVLAHVMGVQSACTHLEIESAREHLDQARALARRYQLNQADVVTMFLDGEFAHLSGDLEGADAAYQRAYARQLSLRAVDADGQRLVATATVRFDQGRLPELLDVLTELYEQRLPSVGPVVALALVSSGRPAAEARRFVADLPPLPVDYLYSLFLTFRAFAVAAVADRERAADVYDELLPLQGQIAGGGTSGYVLNPVDRALGRLAVVLGLPDVARAHFETAIAVARRCGSAVWEAQAEADLASLTLRSPGAGALQDR